MSYDQFVLLGATIQGNRNYPNSGQHEQREKELTNSPHKSVYMWSIRSPGSL
jgi:hypothetical protein